MAQDDDWGDFYDGEQDTLRQQPEQQSRPFFFPVPLFSEILGIHFT
jgi:hypothetical protein